MFSIGNMPTVWFEIALESISSKSLRSFYYIEYVYIRMKLSKPANEKLINGDQRIVFHEEHTTELVFFKIQHYIHPVAHGLNYMRCTM